MMCDPYICKDNKNFLITGVSISIFCNVKNYFRKIVLRKNKLLNFGRFMKVDRDK